MNSKERKIAIAALETSASNPVQVEQNISERTNVSGVEVKKILGDLVGRSVLRVRADPSRDVDVEPPAPTAALV